MRRSSGRSCSARSRLLVERAVHDELVDRLLHHARRLVVGDPADDATDVGPLISGERWEEVRAHVRNNMEVFSSGEGGFVFTQVHNIQQGTPVENVEAMFEAAREFGQLGG